MERLSERFGKLLEVLAAIGCALVFLMMLVICTDVLLRNTALIPSMRGLAWANDLTEAGLYLTTMLAAPWLLRRGQHIRVDIVLRAVPPRVGWLFEWAVDLLAFGYCALIAWYSARAALASFMAGSLSIKTLITPEWWLLTMLPIAFTALSVEMLFRMRRLSLAEHAPRDDAVSTG